MELADLTRVIAPTLSRQLFMMAKQLDDVVDFTLGDPDIPTPLPICEAAAKTSRAGYPRCALNVENIFPRCYFILPFTPSPSWGLMYLCLSQRISPAESFACRYMSA